jgi:hypothetical protein
MSPERKEDPKSVGTVVSEKERARANRFSDEKRRQLTGRGMELIYGEGTGLAKIKTDRR